MPRPAQRTAPVVHIGPGADSKVGTQLIPVLEKIALRATELGRDGVAVTAVEQLGKLGTVQNVSITNSTFHG